MTWEDYIDERVTFYNRQVEMGSNIHDCMRYLEIDLKFPLIEIDDEPLYNRIIRLGEVYG